MISFFFLSILWLKKNTHTTLKTSGLAVFTTKETEAQRGSDLSTITQQMCVEWGPEVTIAGEPVSVCNWTWLGGGDRKGRPDRVSQAALSTPDPSAWEAAARPPGRVGSVWAPRRGCLCPGLPGAGRREDTAMRSAHGPLWSPPGAGSRVRGHQGRLGIQQELGLGG